MTKLEKIPLQRLEEIKPGLNKNHNEAYQKPHYIGVFCF